MKYEITIPDILRKSIGGKMYDSMDTLKCQTCDNFFFAIDPRENKCDVCNGNKNYTSHECDDNGKIVGSTNHDETCAMACESRFEYFKKEVLSINAKYEWKIERDKINEISKCCICNHEIIDETDVMNTHIFVSDDDSVISLKNFRIACNICHEMSGNYSYENLFMRCSNICYYKLKLENSIFYNNASPFSVCQLKYDEIEKIKENKNDIDIISEKDYIKVICGDCYYCGRKSTTDSVNDLTLLNNDVIDSYVKNNCIGVCSQCKLLRGKMNNNKFMDHIKNIYENTVIKPKVSASIFTMTNNSLRLYTYSKDNLGVMTNILINNVVMNCQWEVIHTDDKDILTLKCLNDTKGNEKTDTFRLDNSLHKIEYIGLSQSSSETIKMPLFECDNYDITTAIQNNKEYKKILQKNSDIVFRIPKLQNNIQLSLTSQNGNIVKIKFSCDEKNKYCNCEKCMSHQKNGKCICDKCFEHMLHNNKECSCVPENGCKNEHINIRIFGDNDNQQNHEKDVKFENICRNLKDLNLSECRKKLNITVKKTVKDAKINERNNLTVKKSTQKQIDLMGKEEYRKKKNEYLRKYRQSKKGDKPKKSPLDVKTRMKNYRKRKTETYGTDTYNKITALEVKIRRYKNAGEDADKIEKMKIELSILKNIG
jgi:hypothetical protein